SCGIRRQPLLSLRFSYHTNSNAAKLFPCTTVRGPFLLFGPSGSSGFPSSRLVLCVGELDQHIRARHFPVLEVHLHIELCGSSNLETTTLGTSIFLIGNNCDFQSIILSFLFKLYP
ncbi:hypothetical protein AB205_0013770, partial [Aquarana catesbeiana]